MSRWLIILMVLILAGCGASALNPPPDDSSLITQWAHHMGANDFAAAKALMTEVTPQWEESAKLGLAMAPWKSPRPVELPSNEKPFAPPGAVRMQWDLDVPGDAIYRLICSDVRVNHGKIQGLTRTFPCTSGGVFASGLEPVLFEPGDLPGAIFNVWGALQVDKLLERGMPPVSYHASINAKRSTADSAPGYFVNMYGSDPSGVAAIFKWWQETAPKPLIDISGIGERAFGMETRVEAGTSRSILFTRCEVVTQVEVVTPAGAAPLDFNVIKSAAEKIDQRAQPEVCIKP